MIFSLIALRFISFPWWMPMMAQAAQPAPDQTFSGNWLVNALVILIPVIAAALLVVFGKAHWKAQGNKEAQQVGPQPFIVQMAEEFVTRREFVELKSEIRNDITEIKGLFRETMLKIESQNRQLTEAINDGISEGRLGRVAIWKEVNPLGNKVAALAATGDVAKELGKIAEVLTKQPPHGKNPTGR